MITFDCGCAHQTIRRHDGTDAPVYIDCSEHRTASRRARHQAYTLAAAPWVFGAVVAQAVTTGAEIAAGLGG